MNRRLFIQAMLASGACAPFVQAAQRSPDAGWRDIEAISGGRFGVAVLRADGSLHGHRPDERFPMCSTFKWLAAACVLQRVDAGLERLDRRVRFGSDALLPYSPITSTHVADGMTIEALCRAAVGVSDNAAGNLLLAGFGGPQGLTAYARRHGDDVTRLDRWETELNEATPGDVRDTTTPRAMAQLLRRHLLGDALTETSRRRLIAWMEETTTDVRRLRADLPPGWRLASKTGSGERGTANNVGVFWTPAGEPIVVAAYITQSNALPERRDSAIAAVAQRARDES